MNGWPGAQRPGPPAIDDTHILADQTSRRAEAERATELIRRDYARAQWADSSPGRWGDGTPVEDRDAGSAGPDQEFLDQLRAALVDTDGLDSLPKPDPLIDGILFRNSLAWLVGRPGCGKTFAALDMAGAVATGQSWQGYPTHQGPVLYLAPDTVASLRPRVRAWESGNQTAMREIKWLPLAVQAKNLGAWSALCKLATELLPVLIVIDTQARITIGLDENSASDMSLFVDRLERLRAASNACVLCVHHATRGVEHLRGSTALEGAASTIISVRKTVEMVTLSADAENGGKQRDAEAFDDITLRLVSSDSSAFFIVTGDEGESRASMPDSPLVRKLLVSWWSIYKGEDVSPLRLCETTKTSRSTFDRAARNLVKAGVAVKEGKGNQVTYRLIKDPSS